MLSLSEFQQNPADVNERFESVRGIAADSQHLAEEIKFEGLHSGSILGLSRLGMIWLRGDGGDSTFQYLPLSREPGRRAS